MPEQRERLGHRTWEVLLKQMLGALNKVDRVDHPDVLVHQVKRTKHGEHASEHRLRGWTDRFGDGKEHLV